MQVLERRRPDAHAQTHAVAAFLVDVQIERHMIFPQRPGKHQRVFRRHGPVFGCAPDEARRRVCIHVQFAGSFLHQFR